MKTKLFALAALLVAGLVFGLVPSASAADPVYKTYFGDKAIGGYDAVAYHTDGKAQKGTSKYLFNWKGANWHFSSSDNLAKFTAAPEKYAPQYGGYCAWAAAADKLVKSDPKRFDIYEGKLYLNYNKKTQGEWQADKKGMISRGNANFPALLKK